MSDQLIKELEAQVRELREHTGCLQRSLDRRDSAVESLKADVSELLHEAAATDCGSAQLNRRALTCLWHETCLTCERDELRAELEKLRKHEVSKANVA